LIIKSVASVLSVALIVCSAGCGDREAGTRAPAAAVIPQINGTIQVDGLKAQVRVVRDRWGVPHIYAENQNDLFFAQGFVQAQDRLFQMDLWRRSVQGRLSEVLGGNFIERDAMTRRVQFRGDMAAEWASYGPDANQIATAFTRGINAWVTRAREQLPEEFVLAGWGPEFWSAEDLLNRTDAFLASGNAFDDVLRARVFSSLGPARGRILFPGDEGEAAVVPANLDLAAITDVVSGALRRVGTRPFFMGLAAPVGSNAWAVSRGDGRRPLLAVDPHRPLENPSPRYLVHLDAPGWHVTGATSPWLPGVAIGHNDRIAWGMTAANADTQDIYVERLNPANQRQVLYRGRFVDMEAVTDRIGVKGASEPATSEAFYTRHGPVVAIDPERSLAYVVRWSGSEPGAAHELGALAIDRARSWDEFQTALKAWKMPAAEFVYADADGRIARQLAALVPIRRAGIGLLPVPAGDDRYEWRGWVPLERLTREVDRTNGIVVSANSSLARSSRIREVLADPAARQLEGSQRLQQDVVAWNAGRLVPLLASLRSERAEVEDARQRLLRWDRQVTTSSSDATIYVTWERELVRRLAALRLPPDLAAGYSRRGSGSLVTALLKPTSVWFDAPSASSRDRLLMDALTSAVDQVRNRSGNGDSSWGRFNAVTFVHPFGTSERSRRRFNIGPAAMNGYEETVMSISGPTSDRWTGPSFRAVFDLGDWDRSVAMNAPGQSAAPGTPHFGDLANSWAAGEYFPLAFSPEAVQREAQSTLTLAPR
jgi:penicillin amidase